MDADALASVRARVTALCEACVWIDRPLSGETSFLRAQLRAAEEDGAMVVLVAGDTPRICRALVAHTAYEYTSDAIAFAKPPPDARAIALLWGKRIVLGTPDDLVAELDAAADAARAARAPNLDDDDDDGDDDDDDLYA